MAVYAALALAVLARDGFDLSWFVHAGDRFVDVARLVVPIRVATHADGYDGQFYYRMALAPLRFHELAGGIRFDNPAWRMQRIVYPVLAWALSFGRAGGVAASLFAVNLLGIGAVGLFAARLAARLSLPAWTALAVLGWPGFIIALTHDTTEIVTTALLLAALERHVAGRVLAYAVLGTLASLTRETAVLVLGGVFCLELWRSIRGVSAGGWWRVLLCGLAMLPFLIWREALALLWGGAMQAAPVAENLGWPLAGAWGRLAEGLAALQHGQPAIAAAIRLYDLGSVVWLLGVCAAMATRLPAALRLDGSAVTAAGWLPVAALMSLLTAGGPWIDANGFFRAFTECFVVGCFVLATRPPSRWLAAVMFAGESLALCGALVLSAGGR
jgi:hypothetical protein